MPLRLFGQMRRIGWSDGGRRVTPDGATDTSGRTTEGASSAGGAGANQKAAGAPPDLDKPWDGMSASDKARAYAEQKLRQDKRSVMSANANRTMLRQFFGNLQVLFDICGSPKNEAEMRIHARLHELLTPPSPPDVYLGLLTGASTSRRTWQKAYAAQQLLVMVLPAEFVRAELLKNYAEICEKQPAKKAIYEEQIGALKGAWNDDLARAVLVRMLNDNQWFNSQKFQIRHMTTRYYVRLIYMFVMIALLFFLTLAFLPAFLVLLQQVIPDAGRWGFAGFIYMLSAGFLGASFSMLTSQRQAVRVRSIEAMEVLSGLPMMFLRLMVGAGAAAILYFFFEAGIVSGSVFPSLSSIGFSEIESNTLPARNWSLVPNPALSLMMIWGFLAGFSEKLVSTMLARVDKSMDAEAGGPTHH